MRATIRNATPAQNQLPVRNQTTMAIMAAGKKRKRTLTISTSMSMPIIRRTSKARISNNGGKPKGRGIGGAMGNAPSVTLRVGNCLHLNFRRHSTSSSILQPEF